MRPEYLIYSNKRGYIITLLYLDSVKELIDDYQLRFPDDRYFALLGDAVVYRSTSKESFEITG